MANCRATTNDLDYIYVMDDLDEQMLRKQETAQLKEPWVPPNFGVGHVAGSQRRAYQPDLRASATVDIQQELDSRIAVSRRIRSGVSSRSSFQIAQNCKSPSTDSTTSLAQLRDKLSVLSPLKYNKVAQKIASSPELPVINEAEEFENLSSRSLPKSKHCRLKCYSDSEVPAKTVRNKTECLPVVDEERSADLVLVAAFDNTNGNVTDETVEEFHRNNPNLDFVDLLFEEQHEKEKDIGIISGKLSQDTDVVENTPAEYVRHKKLSLKKNTKTIAQDAPAVNDDETEVIEDTPCYVYDRKERVRTKSKKASEIVPEAVVLLDATTVDSFFSQHANENNRENIISPTLARQINATSSEASDDELIEKQLSEEISVCSSAFVTDIVDCVNSILDKVCSDLDKCGDLQGQLEQQIDNLSSKRNLKANQKEGNPDNTKKFTLKFNQSVKVAPKMDTRKKTAKNYKDTTPSVNSTKSILTRKKRKLYSPKDDENENNEIPNPKTTGERRQSNISQTPIATCYRELENARKSHNRVPEKSRERTQAKSRKKTRYSAYSDGEDPPYQVKIRTSTPSIGSPTTMSRRERTVNPLIYSTWSSSSEDDEHNIAMKPKTGRNNKARRGKIEKTTRKQPTPTPKTRKLNEIFDKMKDNVVNDEKIIFVDNICRKDLSLYNLSSESEYGDFKKTEIQVQKRVSSSSIDSSATKRRRFSRVKYSENSSEDEGKRTLKLKTIKKGKPRNRKTNKIPILNVSDERMRIAQKEILETSFVKENADANNLEVPEPALQQALELEVMPPDTSNDAIVEAEVMENKTNTPKKLNISKKKKENSSRKIAPKVTKPTVTKSKENIKDLSKEKHSAPVSPLPGLVVETERARIDDLPSAMEEKILQKYKKMYTEDQYLNEADDTRTKLLSADENDNAVCEPAEMIETELMSDVMSEKSIATVSRSPITSHDDENESPNIQLLDKAFEHRDVHNEGMSESIVESFGNMRNQLRISISTASQTFAVIPITRISTKESALSNLCAKKVSSRESVNKSISYAESNKSNQRVVLTQTHSPEIESKTLGTPKSKVSVVVTRMSSNEIEKYLTPTGTQKSSNTGSPAVILERMSSDEINKWLPMPELKNKESDDKPKKYNTRQASKPQECKITPKNVGMKIKPNISPVKLTFEDLTVAHHGVTGDFGTRSSAKSMMSHTNTNKEPLKTDSIQSSKARTSKNDQNVLEDTQETITTVTTRSNTDFQNQREPMLADVSDISKSRASVQDWLKRNATPGSPGAAYNKDAVKEMLSHVMEALQTTLAEIHHGSTERLTAAYLKIQEDITRIESLEMTITSMITTFKKESMERVREVLRTDAEQKARMARFLLEDIQGLLDRL